MYAACKATSFDVYSQNVDRPVDNRLNVPPISFLFLDNLKRNFFLFKLGYIKSLKRIYLKQFNTRKREGDNQTQPYSVAKSVSNHSCAKIF